MKESNIDKKNFGKRLDTLMIERECKSIVLEKKLEVGRATISRWRNGHTLPNNSQIKDIANFFNVRYEWLIGLEKNETCIGDMEIGKAIKRYKGLRDYLETLGYSVSPGDYIFDDPTFRNEKGIICKDGKQIEISGEEYQKLRIEIESFIKFKISELF